MPTWFFVMCAFGIGFGVGFEYARSIYAKCRHEFTYWAPREQWDGPGKQWWRRCTKCDAAQLRHSETEPKN